MNPKQIETDYENQSFEDFDVNPYEIVIAVSKMARQINFKAMKYLGPESEIKPINMALRKLESEDVAFAYNEEENNSSTKNTSKNKNESK